MRGGVPAIRIKARFSKSFVGLQLSWRQLQDPYHKVQPVAVLHPSFLAAGQASFVAGKHRSFSVAFLSLRSFHPFMLATLSLSLRATETIHNPAPVRNLSSPKKMGGHRGRISVIKMVFLVFLGVFVSTNGLDLFSARKGSKRFSLVVGVYAFFFPALSLSLSLSFCLSLSHAR